MFGNIFDLINSLNMIKIMHCADKTEENINPTEVVRPGKSSSPDTAQNEEERKNQKPSRFHFWIQSVCLVWPRLLMKKY